MHKPKPVTGRIVLSRAGRDAGSYLVIVGLIDAEYVFVADGDGRSINAPKKKKLKHLHQTPLVSQKISDALDSGRPVSDADIRKEIKALLDDREAKAKAGTSCADQKE